MLEARMDQALISLAELNTLRLEAMDLFEQCLTKGDESALVSFIEFQLIQEPPRLQLMHDLADDLQQRLLSLREYHFDVRDRVVRVLSENYGIDLTALTSPAALNTYHLLTSTEVLAFVQQKDPALSDKDLALLRRMVEASLHMASQLQHDIVLTERLQSLVNDWLEGMNATIARRFWNSSSQNGSIQH
jgi:hypothetical protein